MSQNKKNKPVSPLYAVALLWFFWTMRMPLFTLFHYMPLIFTSVVFYKIVEKIADKKASEKERNTKTQNTESQQVATPVEEKKTTGDPQVDELIKQRDLVISEMRRLNVNIEDEKISAQISDMEYTSTKIFDHVIAHPEKARQISKFLNYYLPTTMKLLNTYDRMGSRGVEGENITGTMKKVEETLDMVVRAFHKQLDTLFAGEALDVSADITVMENLMKNEGLADDGLSDFANTIQSQGTNE